VLLLDEIEKAHPDVFNILLQILEDGRLTDAQGRTVDFRNAIVIMTSNIGAAQIAKNTGLGFTIGDEDGTGVTYEDMKKGIMGELKKVFRPEFLNRIDEVIVFHKLTKAEIKHIVDLLMKRVRETLAEREMSLNLSDEAADLLVEKGWDPAMGARPLRRAIQRYIEDPLADEVLAKNAEPGSTVEVERDADDELGVKITITKPARKPVAVGAGEEGEASEGDGSGGGDQPEDGPLPDEPEVLPDVPDAPPAPEGESDSDQ
jgi:ATP-dependent Clp protease ATP-binding subunit ClpC